jgi:hypothetical protein
LIGFIDHPGPVHPAPTARIAMLAAGDVAELVVSGTRKEQNYHHLIILVNAPDPCYNVKITKR